MKGSKLKKLIPAVPRSNERKYDKKLAPVGIQQDMYDKLMILHGKEIVVADIVREALRQYLGQFFEETEG